LSDEQDAVAGRKKIACDSGMMAADVVEGGSGGLFRFGGSSGFIAAVSRNVAAVALQLSVIDNRSFRKRNNNGREKKTSNSGAAPDPSRRSDSPVSFSHATIDLALFNAGYRRPTRSQQPAN
jgi:hypothetical protein